MSEGFGGNEKLKIAAAIVGVIVGGFVVLVILLALIQLIWEVIKLVFLALACVVGLLVAIPLLAMICDGLAILFQYLRARARFYRNVRGSSWPFHHLLRDPLSASGYLWAAIDYWLGVETVRMREKPRHFS